MPTDKAQFFTATLQPVRFGARLQAGVPIPVPGPKGDKGDPGEPGKDGLSSSFFDYAYNNNATAPPGSGQVRMNNADQTAASTLWLDYHTAPGNDASIVLGWIKAGDTLSMQDQNDATRYQEYAVSAEPAQQSGWLEVPVTWVQGGAALAEQRVFVVWGRVGTPGPAGADGTPKDIADESTVLARRNTLAFVGAGVTATDAGDRIVVTIPGGSSGGGATSMTASAFNAETANGATNPAGYTLVVISDEDTLAMWSGSAWRYNLGPSVSGLTGIRLAEYTWTNQGPASAIQKSQIAGGVQMSIPSVGGTQWRILKRSIPVAPWTITLTLVADRGGNMRQGLVLLDTDGKVVSWTASSDSARSLDYWTSVTQWGSGGNPFFWVAGQMLELRIRHTGSSLEYAKKLNYDADFTTVVTTPATEFLGTLAAFGFGIDGEGAASTASFLSMVVA